MKPENKINSLSGSVVYNQATGKTCSCRFRTTTNTIEFVNSNSDVPYDSTYIAKKIYLLL
jgi:peptidyl-prolyl cis-trans isomerase D